MEPDIEILYEDDVLLAVNKPPRLPVHATRDAGRANLQAILERRLGRKLVLFHRLDADTTGVVLLGKSRAINAPMAALFEHKRLRKTYWAVVRGEWPRSWNRIESELPPRPGRSGPALRAVSTFRVLASTAEKSWLEVLPKTGRTHQIRRQCASRSHPVLGDRLHDVPGELPLALHARRIDLPHPRSGAPLRVVAEPPEYWREVWLAGWDRDQPGGNH